VLQRVDIVFCPFLTLWLDLLEAVEFDFVFRRVYKLLLDIILFGKAIEPKITPNKPNVSNHRKTIFLVEWLLA